MVTQTAIQLESIESPPRTYTKGHGVDAGEATSNAFAFPEQTVPQNSDEGTEGITAFENPNVRAVKGKLLSIFFAIFIAGLNGRQWRSSRHPLRNIVLTVL